MVNSTQQSYAGVALTAPISFGYSRFSNHGAAWFIGRTLVAMLESAGVVKQAVDGLAVSSFSLAPDSAITLTEHFGISPRWLEQLPFGGASGLMALRRAARAVQCGDANIVACIGGDTASPDSFADLVSDFSNFSTDAAYPYGAAGPNGVFSLITQHYMDRYGASREDFGRLCIAQRYNAQHYQHALLRDKPLCMEDYLHARPIAGPVHLYDCVMPCAGGEGFLVMSVDRARELRLPYAELLAADELHNAYADDAVQFRGGWAQYQKKLYDAAGVTPATVDLVQTYDDYPVISMLQLEDLGFCEKGKAADFVRETSLTFDGAGLPHNTSGGQLSCGQAGAAAGYLGVVETIRQLTDQSLGNQVPGANIGLVSGYGMVNYDRGLCSAAAILARPAA